MLWQVASDFFRVIEFGLNDELRINEKRSPAGVTSRFIQHLKGHADFLVPVAYEAERQAAKSRGDLLKNMMGLDTVGTDGQQLRIQSL
ncbi:hypothetical protein WQ57_20735 [Mesobacillus campisalis]|uniref:Uncharacterized protein n=1 Tax=Mesobacillus campisalis TaxID=1408103 RepID=A0A0M2SNL6_9BACI|nr:hypothetical protein WQ57_20735 [Mesobacillus campisalis]